MYLYIYIFSPPGEMATETGRYRSPGGFYFDVLIMIEHEHDFFYHYDHDFFL